MNEIKLVLPSVPSLNHVYRNVAINRRILMPKGKAWKEEVGWIAATQRAKQSWAFSTKEKLVMELEIFWPDRRRRDADNCLKLLADTLEGILFEDDKWILPRVLNWDVDKDDPRVEVKIYKLNNGGN
jgi:crossover junction endodeoxyribonuclease RusA